MTDASLIDTGEWPGFEQRRLPGTAVTLSIRIGGPSRGAAVLFNHSLLTSSAVWRHQAALLVRRGFRVVCLDTRGHGNSAAEPAPYTLDDLVADNIVVLDALGIERAHFVGVSLGGMTGFGLGVHHAARLLSLCIIAARADAPPPFVAAWEDRIVLANAQGVAALVEPTARRWFGEDFLTAHRDVAQTLYACIRQTSTEGFIGCARAIQGLDYLDSIAKIAAPTTLLVGSRDELHEPMQKLAPEIHHAQLQVIEHAGHLPQIDQPDAFATALLGHFERVRAFRDVPESKT